MPRIILSAIQWFVIVCCVASCDSNEPSWVKLPTNEEIPYHIFLMTYEDGNYADQPFSIKATPKDESSELESQPISAEQCKNVKLAQTPDRIVLFYDELVLKEFSSFQYSENLPRPFLCDLQVENCMEMLNSLMAANQLVSDICTHS